MVALAAVTAIGVKVTPSTERCTEKPSSLFEPSVQEGPAERAGGGAARRATPIARPGGDVTSPPDAPDAPWIRLYVRAGGRLSFEAPRDEVETLRPIVCETMEGAFEMEVPLKVEIEAGLNWEETR